MITADIVKAFLQISVHSQDKNVHRFLMPSKNGVKHMRFNRVFFGNTSSPYILNATVKCHLSNYSDCEVVQYLNRDVYVENWFSELISNNAIFLSSLNGHIHAPLHCFTDNIITSWRCWYWVHITDSLLWQLIMDELGVESRKKG